MRKALLLAAGLSSRIREVAGDLPKPLMPFAGAPVLAHNLRWLAGGGVREVWINLHYGAEQIRTAIGDGECFGLRTHYVHEPQLLGTAGASPTSAKSSPSRCWSSMATAWFAAT